ncbi:hypothetical protein VNO78_05978 [Psophocarpus tetragonolobus]|uniref:Uncharacterized protein n=1 Tax=Psophocarpus tetragonolobus TaxID=3891 RepID=A0AAN9T1G9_PSOTE
MSLLTTVDIILLLLVTESLIVRLRNIFSFLYFSLKNELRKWRPSPVKLQSQVVAEETPFVVNLSATLSLF